MERLIIPTEVFFGHSQLRQGVFSCGINIIFHFETLALIRALAVQIPGFNLEGAWYP